MTLRNRSRKLKSNKQLPTDEAKASAYEKILRYVERVSSDERSVSYVKFKDLEASLPPDFIPNMLGDMTGNNAFRFGDSDHEEDFI